MKYRKIIAGVIALSLVMSLASGCSKETVKEDDETTTTVESEEPTTTTEETSELVPETEETTAETETSETEPAQTVVETVMVDNSYQFESKTFPVLDGSTSMKPLAIGLIQVLLNYHYENAEKKVDMHRTTASFNYLISGESDLLLVAQPNQSAFDAMVEADFEYEMEEIAVEGLVFMVNSTNPVDSLTIEQLQDIYSGKITNWSEVGGNDMPIAAFQRNESSGSQVMMVETVMGDIPMMEVESEMVPTEMGELIEAVRGYDNSANAIGYTVYYYANDMKMADGLKIIKVEGVEATPETLASGEYPLRSAYYAVMASRENASEPTVILYDWLVCEEGKALLSLLGYVPVA